MCFAEAYTRTTTSINVRDKARTEIYDCLIAQADTSSDLLIARSVFQDNEARHFGGAIDSWGKVVCTDSTFRFNRAQFGGGVACTIGKHTVRPWSPQLPRILITNILSTGTSLGSMFHNLRDLYAKRTRLVC